MAGMSALKDRLRADLTTAMKARDELRSATLRMVLTAVTNEEVSGKKARELSDDEVLKVLTREAKKRREAQEAYTQAGRTELGELQPEQTCRPRPVPPPIEPKPLEQRLCFGAQELAADLMVRARRPLEHNDRTAAARKLDGKRGTREPAADDDRRRFAHRET